MYLVGGHGSTWHTAAYLGSSVTPPELKKESIWVFGAEKPKKVINKKQNMPLNSLAIV